MTINNKNLKMTTKKETLLLDTFWKQLKEVRHLSIKTESGFEGVGEVAVVAQDETLLFQEKGQWIYPKTHALDFSNTLCWSFDRKTQMISLEHLRYGSNHPVFLFHLAPREPNHLESVAPHLCRDDCYSGRIEFDEKNIRFTWRILGPKKNEVLYHTYE